MEESNWGEAVWQGPEIPNRNPQSPENRKKIKTNIRTYSENERQRNNIEKHNKIVRKS